MWAENQSQTATIAADMPGVINKQQRRE